MPKVILKLFKLILKSSFYVAGLLISVLLSAGFAFSEELDLRLTRLVKNENADLKTKLNARKLIEKAKEILMGKHNINEQETFRKMQKTAMDKHTSMKEIAESIIMTA